MRYDVSVIGKNIRRLRRANGMMQYDLSDALGYEHVSGISVYECGKKLPGAKTLAKLAEVFECSVEELFRDPSS